MENSLKGLILAAGVIITCIVVGLGFFISREAKNAADSGTNQLSAMSSQYDNVEFMMYDGLKVTGSEVVNVIKKHAGVEDLTITVKTKDSTSTQKAYSSKDAAMPAKESSDYINPSALFLGELERDNNNSLVKIKFTQQ